MKVKRQGTSKFVRDLVTAWLHEITSPEILDEFEKLITDRRKTLLIETIGEEYAKVVAGLKECKIGNTLYVVKPLPIKTTEDDMSNYARMEHTRLKCTFWQYKPRKKILWVTVPWPTAQKHHGQNFICLSSHDLKMFKPSRTEVEVRVRNEERRRSG